MADATKMRPISSLPPCGAERTWLDVRCYSVSGYFRFQRLDGLAHRLWRDMDQSSEPSLQLEDHSNGARYSQCAECQGNR